MKKKGTGLLCAICVGMLMLTGCGGASPMEFDSREEAMEALGSAHSVTVEGNVANTLQTGDILADGKAAAYLKEEGFLDTTWTVSVDGSAWFYLRYVADEPVNNLEGENTGTTYGYYDGGGSCLGYAQKRLVETEILPRNYYFVFLNADGTVKDYIADEYGRYLYDYEGNEIGSAEGFMDSFLGNACHVEINTDAPVDFMDKMALYILQFQELNDRYLSYQ